MFYIVKDIFSINAINRFLFYLHICHWKKHKVKSPEDRTIEGAEGVDTVAHEELQGTCSLHTLLLLLLSLET